MKKRSFLFVLILVAITQQLTAQTPPWAWAQNWGYMGNPGGPKSIASNNQGFIYSVGEFTSATLTFGSVTLINGCSPMNNAVFLVKHDTSGNAIWAKTFSGNFSSAHVTCVTIDNTGNIYVSGSFNGDSVNFGNTYIKDPFSSGFSDNMFLVKYDSNGNDLWSKAAKSTVLPGYCSATGVTTDANGNAYITGFFYGSQIVFDNDTLFNTNASSAFGHDIFILKSDPLGNIIWVKKAGGSNSEDGLGITLNGSNIYITGNFISDTAYFDNISLIHTGITGFDNFFIAKMDTGGNFVWARTSSQGNSLAHQVASAANGLIYVAGDITWPTLVIGPYTLTAFMGSYNFRNFFVALYDDGGNVVWAKCPDQDYDSRVYGLAADNIGNCYITGTYAGNYITFDSFTLNNPYTTYEDMITVKYNSSGAAQWVKSAGGTYNEFGKCIALDNGGVFVAGIFWQDDIHFDNITLYPATGSFIPYDMFIAKIPQALNVGIHDNFLSSASIFPNPFNEYIKTSFNSNENFELIIYDCLLQNILQQKVNSSSVVNTRQLALGVYIYELRNGSGILKKGKLIKQ